MLAHFRPQKSIPRVNVIYVRLSRDEADKTKRPASEKLQERRDICLALAKQHGLSVNDADIYLENESGATISGRVIFREVLARAHAGEISHLITPAVDRLLRGDLRDEVDVTEALTEGRVVVISGDTEPLDFSDPEFELKQGLLFGLKRLVARQYIHDNAKKHRAANLNRAKAGIKSSGIAPYGYRWVPSTYLNKMLTCSGHYELSEAEYAIIVEIFRRIRSEGIHTIVRELNKRYLETGFPPPPGKARGRRGDYWHNSVLKALLSNPHYAGRPAHRMEWQGLGKKPIALPIEKWIMPEHELSFPHPVTWGEWNEIQKILESRGLMQIGNRPLQPTILAGLLYCSNDNRMTGNGLNYMCHCMTKSQTHAGNRLRKERVENAVSRTICLALEALPVDLLTRHQKRSEGENIPRQVIALQNVLSKAREQRRDMILNRQEHICRFGEEGYADASDALSSQIRGVEVQIEQLQSQKPKIHLDQNMPLLIALRDAGFDRFWGAATVPEKREILHLFIKRVDMVPIIGKVRAVAKEVKMEWQNWVKEFYMPPTTILLESRADKWRIDNNLSLDYQHRPSQPNRHLTS